ncbi:hypothetical protein RFI_19935 [Reticulomyxa filosa]|uniref:Uncharacterized protein n=1 Tax=Reticulomyxa filosa TaxID=46433 RepID=X6MVD5_RETFI|nr:hypothetical protein RFI_19935 [Reticulomyxa filosa]|eukprot:ETO17392.1 hypothetical protein RFI_19935 [Reticulomyxa filosa]
MITSKTVFCVQGLRLHKVQISIDNISFSTVSNYMERSKPGGMKLLLKQPLISFGLIIAVSLAIWGVRIMLKKKSLKPSNKPSQQSKQYGTKTVSTESKEGELFTEETSKDDKHSEELEELREFLQSSKKRLSKFFCLYFENVMKASSPQESEINKAFDLACDLSQLCEDISTASKLSLYGLFKVNSNNTVKNKKNQIYIYIFDFF